MTRDLALLKELLAVFTTFDKPKIPMTYFGLTSFISLLNHKMFNVPLKLLFLNANRITHKVNELSVLTLQIKPDITLILKQN